MKRSLSLFAFVGILVLSGCSQETSQADISNDAKKLTDSSQGKPSAPPIPGLQQVGGGNAVAKPGKK